MQSLLELTELSVFALSMGVAITTFAALIHGTLGFGLGPPARLWSVGSACTTAAWV